MNSKLPIHLLLRFSDSLLKSGDTISAHTQVIEHEGAVWFGKMGSPLSQERIDILNSQVENGIPTYIFLVKGNRRKSTAYCGSLILASKTIPEDEINLIPKYYFELGIPKYVQSWVKLSKIVPIEYTDLAEMQVVGSVLPLGETLVKSSSGHFFIREIR